MNNRISVVIGTPADARREILVLQRDRRRRDDQVGGDEILGRMLAESKLDRQAVELLHRLRQLLRRRCHGRSPARVPPATPAISRRQSARRISPGRRRQPVYPERLPHQRRMLSTSWCYAMR